MLTLIQPTMLDIFAISINLGTPYRTPTHLSEVYRNTR